MLPSSYPLTVTCVLHLCDLVAWSVSRHSVQASKKPMFAGHFLILIEQEMLKGILMFPKQRESTFLRNKVKCPFAQPLGKFLKKEK